MLSLRLTPRCALLLTVMLIIAPGNEGIWAQNSNSQGQNWSSSWGFGSPSDQSLRLQQAQAIRQAQIASGPSTVVSNHTTNNNNIVNDSRSSYQEIVGEGAGIGTDFHLNGDRIGQNTNSVGSMNTGTTNIEVVGENNSIIATNSSESDGCIDGSAQQESSLFESMASPSGIDISVGNPGRSANC